MTTSKMATTEQRNSRVSDAEALALVMEMMAIPGRSGEEAAVMDFIRGKLIDGRRRRRAQLRDRRCAIAARRSAARSATWC